MTPPAEPVLSVVIVAWNSAASLPRCLDALSHQTYRDFEVLVIDNASEDGGALGLTERYAGLRLRLERLESNIGFAAASNLGARLARGVWLAVLNPDAFPEPDWLEMLVTAGDSRTNSFFASRQIQANRPMLLDGEGDIYYSSGLALRANYNSRYDNAGPPREVFSACAAAALYPRRGFLEAGGFDEDYFAYHEDVDLGFRLRLLGMRCYLVPAAVVFHIGAYSTGSRSAFAVYHGHRNLVWTYVKNMPAPWFWLYLPLHIAVNILSIIYFVFAGHPVAILRAKLDALRGLSRALSKRQVVQSQCNVAGTDVVRQMNRNPFGPLEGWVSRQWPDLE
jgi:GT2 family glycosyltransferase